MLHVDKPDSMMTEPLYITARSLTPNATYEIVLRLNHQSGILFGRGLYKANDEGIIDLRKTAPLRGTYSGVRSMGLFEGLMPSDKFRAGNYCKCTPPDPFHFILELRDCASELLHSLPLIKRWLHPAVVRKDIEEDSICGTLFLPPGDGPFPTILDISGTGGGLNEHKSATLASEGFCVLALAFFQYKTLIEDLNDLDLDYFKVMPQGDDIWRDVPNTEAFTAFPPLEDFKKAIDWLISRPFTRNEIGIQGVSFGGLLVNMLAVRHPEIVAVCSINGSHCLTEMAKIKEHGEYLPYVSTAISMIYYINGALCCDKAVQYLDVTPEADIRIETAPKRTAFRFVSSLDDLSTPTVYCSRMEEKKLKDSGHYVEVDFAPGGHLMEPPYFPCLPVVYSKFAGCMQAYGGEPSQHGASQPRVWSNTVAFFKRFLGNPKPLPDYRHESRSHL